MKYRSEIEEYIAGCIRDNDEKLFASTGYSFDELSILKTLEEMDDGSLIGMFYEYSSGYDTIDELVHDIEERLAKETSTCVITRIDRIRLGEVDPMKSLTENFSTVMALYERACWSSEQIVSANDPEVYEAEWVLSRALDVLHDKIPEVIE